MKKITVTENTVFSYIAFVPDKTPENPPIIFQLHGAGEAGNGKDELEKVLVHGIPRFASDETLKGAILVCPQCPLDTFWTVRMESLKKFMDGIVEEFNGDKDRLYVCGLSMGGYGTWYTALAYPDMFAAAAPCCGGGMPWRAYVLKDLPVWTFHGLKDDVVNCTETKNMVEAIKMSGGNKIKVDYYENVGHDAWNYAFKPELIDWMLSHKRGEK